MRCARVGGTIGEDRAHAEAGPDRALRAGPGPPRPRPGSCWCRPWTASSTPAVRASWPPTTCSRRSPHRVLARFDHDQLFDYRARRPVMVFAKDHWESYDAPVLALHLLNDLDGQHFLLLAGPEPDVQWERFAAAVESAVPGPRCTTAHRPQRDPDGAAAHPPGRGHRPRRAAVAGRGLRALDRDRARAGERRAPARAPARRGRLRGDGVRGPRAALRLAGGLPRRRCSAGARGGQGRRRSTCRSRPSTRPPTQTRAGHRRAGRGSSRGGRGRAPARGSSTTPSSSGAAEPRSRSPSCPPRTSSGPSSSASSPSSTAPSSRSVQASARCCRPSATSCSEP